MKFYEPKPSTIASSVAGWVDEQDAGLSRCLVDSLSDEALFALTLEGNIRTWNSGAHVMFGYTREEVIGRHFSLIFTSDDIADGVPREELAQACQGKSTRYERWHIRKDGSRFWGSNTVAPMYENGQLIGIAKLVADTTQNYHARTKLWDSEERLRLLVESVPDYAIFSVGFDGSITTWNSAAHSTFGFSCEEIVGFHYSKLFRHEDVTNGVPQLLFERVAADGMVDEERWFVRKDGSRFIGSEKVSRLKAGADGISRGFVHVAHDITERNHRTDDLRRQASLDSLTSLPNRKTFFEHVQRAIATMKRRSNALFAVMFIDLDHFKRVNDTFGHLIADRLLEITARRLESCVRAEDVVARIGGDEFAILINGVVGIGDANDAAERISAEMRKPITVGTQSVRATVSVGIALGKPGYTQPEEILHDADAAMYAAKSSGRGRSIVFMGDAQGSASVIRDATVDLHRAVARGELRLTYQPVVRLADSTIAGFEALVRWQHPVHGLLHPRDFIKKAEESSLIVEIDRWVLFEACRTLARWRSEFGRPELTMSINFSVKEFSQPDVLNVLVEALAQNKLPAQCLNLEITESAIPERSERTDALLTSIHELGIELQIDDFGVGYASLAALAHVPVRALKIDREFVAVMESPKGAILLRTIAYLTKNLGLKTIAEGIETVSQIDGLLAVGCDFGQGFVFSEPVDADTARQLLRPGAIRTPRARSIEQTFSA